ncbi:transposase [Bathymodiolus platifrons methanotrophic gill symbiont]|uniref:transposase n=1 Tax=Bathymodiolus platifrons methanotrophic gill symbiont TaxID=113268 RepID=UPI001124CD1F
MNNGVLEGLNSVLQAAKRKARGYKMQHFKTIAYLLTGKLDFSKINPNYYPLEIQQNQNSLYGCFMCQKGEYQIPSHIP